MKKILFLLILVLVLFELNAHGACLIENLKIKSTCTGGASDIRNPEEPKQNNDNFDRKDLENIYQIPTMALPESYKNDFPMLNQNCMYGACFPK